MIPNYCQSFLLQDHSMGNVFDCEHEVDYEVDNLQGFNDEYDNGFNTIELEYHDMKHFDQQLYEGSLQPLYVSFQNCKKRRSE